MATFVALYSTPSDVDGFDEHYRDIHMPLAEKWPGVKNIRVVTFSSTPRGTEPSHHLMFTAEWDSDEEMAAALRSEAGMAAAKDAMAMAEKFGVTPTMLLGGDFLASPGG